MEDVAPVVEESKVAAGRTRLGEDTFEDSQGFNDRLEESIF